MSPMRFWQRFYRKNEGKSMDEAKKYLDEVLYGIKEDRLTYPE